MDDRLKMLNFASWVAFYEYIKEMGWEEKVRIRIHPSSIEEVGAECFRSPNHPFEFDIVEIKAHAFEELYAIHPRPAALEIMRECALELKQANPAAEVILHYFNKLKART